MILRVAAPAIFTSAVQRLKLEYWIAAQNSAQKKADKPRRDYNSKQRLWDFLDTSIIQGKKIIYLEFGVYR